MFWNASDLEELEGTSVLGPLGPHLTFSRLDGCQLQKKSEKRMLKKITMKSYYPLFA